MWLIELATSHVAPSLYRTVSRAIKSHLTLSSQKKKLLYVFESSKNICNPQVVRLVLGDKEVDVYSTDYKKYVGEISWVEKNEIL